jgi:hypothetical protein
MGRHTPQHWQLTKAISVGFCGPAGAAAAQGLLPWYGRLSSGRLQGVFSMSGRGSLVMNSAVHMGSIRHGSPDGRETQIPPQQQ